MENEITIKDKKSFEKAVKAMNNFGNALDSIATAIGDALKPIFNCILDVIARWIKTLEKQGIYIRQKEKHCMLCLKTTKVRYKRKGRYYPICLGHLTNNKIDFIKRYIDISLK